MSSPETAGATKPSLAREWLYALRYWLRGRRGAAVLVVSAVVIGAALNWSWLVAVGIAPLLLTALPCVAMCALGLCMNRMTGGSCSTPQGTAEDAGVPTPTTVERLTASEPVEGAPVSPSSEPAPDDQPHVRKERK